MRRNHLYLNLTYLLFYLDLSLVLIIYSTATVSLSVTSESIGNLSSTLLNSFTLHDMKFSSITILSFFNYQLLVGEYKQTFFIFNQNMKHIRTIHTKYCADSSLIRDAIWTPKGDILYAQSQCNKVYLISDYDAFITANTVTDPRKFSIFDNNIYLADYYSGVYQSTDDGFTWTLILKSANEGHFCQAIKIIADSYSYFWTLEMLQEVTYLQVYRADTRNADSTETFINTNLNRPFQTIVEGNSQIWYDGRTFVFAGKSMIQGFQVYSLNGEYRFTLLPSENKLHSKPNYTIMSVTMDREHRIIFFGTQFGILLQSKLIE